MANFVFSARKIAEKGERRVAFGGKSPSFKP
jgi:hypothetical protein